MNVNDVKDDIIPTPTPEHDRLALIFERQKSLMSKYHPIERANGFVVLEAPVGLHDRFGQARLKDFAWRVTEEIGEATAARIDHPGMPEHFHEELADAFHFLVELSIIAGWHPSDVRWPYGDDVLRRDCRLLDIFEQFGDTGHGNIRVYAYACVEQLTRAMNCLKCKPWKQTHIMTDVDKFNEHLLSAFICFFSLCDAGGMSGDKLFRTYFKKSAVNAFRQRTAY